MPRDHERRARSRSHERYRDRGDNYERSRKHRDDYHRKDRDYGYEERDLDRDRYRHDKEKKKERDGRRRHERNHSDERWKRRSRSTSPVSNVETEVVEYEEVEPSEPITEEEAEMMRNMGFCNFSTTKGKHVVGNSIYVANIAKQRKYRQYMNRRGGFNRPLDPVA
ncbi:unnamed protein product [Heterobilharzia americana]|nr:unnamed protein product [Heterobilharzia americana]CAH8463329.1 unnamed protein product [Heterobilharzia americana]